MRRHRSVPTALAIGVLSLAAWGCMSTRSPGKQVDDAWITSKVESKLAADPDVNNFEIDVDTNDGTVRLSGMVESAAGREEAERIARSTEGVRGVVNEIKIGDPTLAENVTDAWILTKIKSKLVADPQVSAFNIDVDVLEGKVTLSGEVAKAVAKSEAEKLARATRGVKSVDNKIEVRTQ
jgi:osmotically-inducible protein OsmY